MIEAPMRVRVAETVLRGFRRRALKVYPKEWMETVWGRVTPQGIDIFAFHPIDHKGTRHECQYVSSDIDAQRDEEAPEYKLELLGTCHSHPDALDAPSYADWETTVSDKEIISGIYQILRRPQGKRKFTRVRFYSGAVHEMEVTRC